MAVRPRVQAARLRTLIARLEPKTRKAFMEAMSFHAQSVDVPKLIALIESNSIEAAIALIAAPDAAYLPLLEGIRGTYIEAGQAVAAFMPSGIRGVYAFDGRSRGAERWIAEKSAELIQGIREDTQAMARLVLEDGQRIGRSSASIARDIVGRVNPLTKRREGGFIGLTTQQTESITRGRADLLSNDPARLRRYLTLRQRDRTNDRAIRAAIKSGVPISPTKIDSMIAGHTSKALRYRGQLIAQNETHTAQAAAQREGFAQARDREDVEQVTKKWSHGLSKEPREDHQALDGKTLPFDQNFIMGDGTLMANPHDPRGGVKHSAFCRCVCIYRVILARD